MTSTPNTVQLQLDVPEQLYERLLRLSEGKSRNGAAALVLEVLERTLAQEPHVTPAKEPFDFDKHAGMGREFFVDDDAFDTFLKAAQGPSYIDIARLARPDGETLSVSFRMTTETAAWLEERREILSSFDGLQAFYSTIDTATTARHLLAQEIVSERPLSTPPPSGGQPTTLKLPRELHKKLQERLPEVIAGGARSSAGVGTVIRWVLAQMMKRAQE